MKTSKIIILIFMFIAFAFLHVFLQIEIIKLGYQVKRNEDRFQELVDNNNILKYNIYALESPYSLNKYAQANSPTLRILKPVQVLSLYTASKTKYFQQDKNKSFLFNSPVFLALKKLFSGRQAEARTIK